jgi:cytochrome oxidase Cu insertion factor (SCO1/SenC/PrrC family)
LYSAKLRYDLARKRQLSILLVGFVLFCVGVSVFARASKNWYEQVQRYEDAKLQKEVELHTGANEVSVTKELLKLGKPVIVGILLALLLAWVVS